MIVTIIIIMNISIKLITLIKVGTITTIRKILTLLMRPVKYRLIYKTF
jgi:hypothetical protein